ncbi:hypothetical protein BG011_002620 [Mortierella polycephala]|uniref:Xylanolytic transcriptional activator regulatory domain-containing protein n=1 Tax=Mortierella polycephala TaxID=41804 RepID=A0A9P6Q2Y1_9FUNG|nr:hypothetical protein BG011_002620 [Mortierella polycephala]
MNGPNYSNASQKRKSSGKTSPSTSNDIVQRPSSRDESARSVTEDKDRRPTVSTMSLDAYLNDSDLWSHSLQITNERELPSKDVMENLLSLYFRFIYPSSPMFIQKTFMEDHRHNRPDLSQILILNAIFCNACYYSDDPVMKQDSTKYFSRAKIILDETYHISRISTVQALLLMSHHQYANGNYSGGWLYTGMATQIAYDIGLHRQDVLDEPETVEIMRRVWWALYISDRFSSGVLGRPMSIRDEAFSVKMPSADRIPEVIGEDTVEHPHESERIISCRLFWAVKLFMQMGKVLSTMYCIEAEINDVFLAEISRTQLPRLHNNLMSWFTGLPDELMYTPYTMSPDSDRPPSPPTALVHMCYYTCLTMLHRPYLRPISTEAIDANFLISSRNICTAAATNVCHIADSLMLHGQIKHTFYYGIACLLAAGTVHVHNAIAPTPSNRETTRAGLFKTVRATHELVKTFPVAESLTAVALDVFVSQTSSVLTESVPAFIDISTFVAPFMDMAQLQNSSIGNIYEAARLAKLTKDGPGPAPSIQLRHPYGNFSTPLPESTRNQSATSLNALWQTQITTAIAMAAIAFGGTEPQLLEGQQFFTNPLDLPDTLRLASIETMMFSEMDTMAAPNIVVKRMDALTGTTSRGNTDPTFQPVSGVFTTAPVQQQQQQQSQLKQQHSHMLQYQGPDLCQEASTQFSTTTAQSLVQVQSSNLISDLQMHQSLVETPTVPSQAHHSDHHHNNNSNNMS